MRRPPTTASVTEYSCSIRRGASGQSAPVPLDWNSLAYQTFYSSKDSASRFVEPRRAPTAYTVLPPISRDEVAARIADGGDPQLLYEIQYVFAESVGVCRRMAGPVDAGVDASAHMFDERAEQSAWNRSHAEGGVGGESCVDHGITVQSVPVKRISGASDARQ
jgi:hypothetical protein